MDSSKKPQLKNPKTGCSILSQLVFAWIVPVWWKGCTSGLNADNLTKCLPDDRSTVLGDRLEVAWQREQEQAKRSKRAPKLKWALFSTFGNTAAFEGLLFFAFVLTRTLLPVVLAQLLTQFAVPSADLSNMNVDNWLESAWNDTFWLAVLLILMTVLGFMFNHHSEYRSSIIGARMRIAMCSLIYRKTLRLSQKSTAKTTVGYLVNLLSNDANRLDLGFVFVHFVWILPLQSVLISYLIWRKAGVAAVVGVSSLLLMTVPVQTGLSRVLSKIRWKVALRTDERVNIMNEIVKGIQVIKMNAWEKSFAKVVNEARRLEIQHIRYATFIRGINVCTMVFVERSTLFITICAMIMLGQRITADVVFSMAQFFNILQLSAAYWYPAALGLGAEALVSIQRVEDLLLMEERNCAKKKYVEVTEKIPLLNTHPKGVIKNKVLNTKNALELTNVSATWDKTNCRKTLDNVSFDVKAGSLCAIIGSVGSGKSSLLNVLLEELPIDSGETMFADNTKISYASQAAWLFTGTIRNNILFGQPFDQIKYQEVIQCCALTTDFIQLPNGDQTIVGERGATLSGGQRARISLARSIYNDATIYLLDDPLSAVDTHVSKHLFDEVIGPRGRLANMRCTRLLATHQLHFLKEADHIIILDKGRIVRQGSYDELVNSDHFQTILSQSSNTAGDQATDDIYAPNKDFISVTIGATGSNMKIQDSKPTIASNCDDVEEHEEQTEGGVSIRVWKKYFSAGGTGCTLFMLVFVMFISQVVICVCDYFVKYFTQQAELEHNGSHTVLTQHQCLYIYGSLIIGVITFSFLRGYTFFAVCMRASKNLHNKMFGRLLGTSMRFFYTHPSGQVLNRFSKDMGSIDEQLPQAMIRAVEVALIMSGILVIVTIVNPILITYFGVSAVLFGLIVRLYLKPSQDLRRLEGICRSPVFSHLSASLSGLSTIRSYQLENRLVEEFDGLQDTHSAVWHLNVSSNSAFSVLSDCISSLFIACVTFSFVALKDDTFSGNAGLAISQSMIFTGMVQHGLRQWTLAMQLMTSVERVLQYTDLKQEVKRNNKPPSDWPQLGKVEFRSMSLQYDPDEHPALVDLNIEIGAGWKVGVVGRTGAGKSTLISALFRLAPIEGDIIIDDIETGSINLDILRSKVSIIPQNPVLFSASIRYNLDPFNRYSDDELWQSLAAVELRSTIPHLEFIVTESGANFSVGQRQLICMARAILRNNKILVLDEATANVDPQTDALIQSTIRERFTKCTILTVAHRLHTVMGCDRIIVMDAGRVREFDRPHMLLQRKDGIFLGMVNAAGPQEAGNLKKMAADAYALNIMKL